MCYPHFIDMRNQSFSLLEHSIPPRKLISIVLYLFTNFKLKIQYPIKLDPIAMSLFDISVHDKRPIKLFIAIIVLKDINLSKNPSQFTFLLIFIYYLS